ncbi:MAG: hypothetical protein ACREL5_12440 [Gemmatimonadales bacterium]
MFVSARRLRTVAIAFVLAGLLVRSVHGQTVDWGRVAIGISIGSHSGPDLWDVTDQPILSSNLPNGNPKFRYPPDTFRLDRAISAGITVAVHVSRFVNPHLGFNLELEYIGLKSRTSCELTHDGGDVELAIACGATTRDGNPAPEPGLHELLGSAQPGSAFLVQGGAVVHPFRPARLQPYVEVLAGFGVVPNSTIATTATYVTSGEYSKLIIYRDDGWKQLRPVLTVGAGINTAPASGLQFHAEVRETVMPLSAVSGPTTMQGLQPPHRSTLKAITGLILGVDVILGRAHGKRY